MKIKAFVCYFLLLGCLSSAAACGGDDEGAPVPPPPAPPEDAGSGNMRVKTRGENLYIAAKMDGERDIVYWFKRCMFNELYTFYRVGIVRNTASEPIRDPSREPEIELNLAFSDNIGPFAVSGYGWCGANHSYKEGQKVRTAYNERFSVRANDRPVTGDVTLLADSVTVDVVNVILDPSRPLEDGELRDPLCRETVHYRIEGRNIEVSASHLFCNTAPVTIETYYGMQSMFANETQTFTSGGAYTDWTVQSGVSQFLKGDYPEFRRFVERNASAYQSSFLLPGGLGDHGMLGDGDIVFIGNSSAKSYHKLISRQRFENGDRIAWRGVYTWFAEPLADDAGLFCYEGAVAGRRALFLDVRVACSRMLELPSGLDARRFDLLDANGDLRVEASGKSALRLSAGGPGGCVLLFGGEDGAEGE